MASLDEQIKDAMKAAMKAKEQTKLQTMISLASGSKMSTTESRRACTK